MTIFNRKLVFFQTHAIANQTEKESMKSFAEILKDTISRDKNSSRASQSPVFSRENATTTSMFDSAFFRYQTFEKDILLQCEPIQFHFAKSSKVYPKGTTSAQPQAAERTPHSLDSRQQMAFEFYVAAGASLTLAFNREELKRSFRQLAKKLHPDHGGSALDFRRLLEHHKYLLAVFSK